MEENLEVGMVLGSAGQPGDLQLDTDPHRPSAFAEAEPEPLLT